MVSNRTEVRPGVWQYADDSESQFAFEMVCVTGFDLSSIDNFLEDARLPADIRDHLLETRSASLHDYVSGSFDLAVSRFQTLHARCLYYGLSLAVAPDIQLVEKFKGKGRGKGPVRKAIRDLLDANPGMKTTAIWSAIKAHPPRGHTVMENRIGKYIEGLNPGENMDYKRFSNVCSEERKAVRST